jgi:hypothetical protein
MIDGGGRAVLLVRALALAATTLALSAGAHVVGGGHQAPPAILTVLGLLLLAAAVPFVGRRLGIAALVAWVATGQLAVHTALAWLHPVAGTQVAIAGHHGLQSVTTAPSALTPGAMDGMGDMNGALMVSAHLVGTLIAIVLLLATDRSATAVRRRWGWVCFATQAVRVHAGAPILLPDARPTHRTARPLDTTVRRRGPPFALAA